MTYLWIVTVLWAFSFSLIGVFLSGQVDSYFAVFSRTFLASLMFLPLIRWKQVPAALAGKLMGIGAVQLGVMFICFYHSFSFLSVPEVVLFTVFTPIYITLLYDAANGRFTFWYLLTAAAAVAGAAVIRYNPLSQDFLVGFLLVQAANACFAIGQVAYKNLMENRKKSGLQRLPQHSEFGFFYLGALGVAALGWLIWGDMAMMPETTVQWAVLLWLGVAASGVGYFLWNKGATLVNAGALAVMNNALVPAGLVVNLVIWNRDVDLLRLIAGGALIVLALWLNESWAKQRVEQHAGHG
jgi:carboxylate/amino acid/amine transporter